MGRTQLEQADDQIIPDALLGQLDMGAAAFQIVLLGGIRLPLKQNLRIHYFRTFFQQDIARFLEKDSAEYLSKLTVDAEVIGQKLGCVDIDGVPIGLYEDRFILA